MTTVPIRIILADDHKIVRESWKMLLENNAGFRIIADCNNGQDAIDLAIRLVPDIMLVDINMEPVNGFHVAETLTKTAPAIKIIGLSVNNLPKFAAHMFRLGAKGFLTKTSTLDEINHGILEVYKGNSYICDEVRNRMTPEEKKILD